MKLYPERWPSNVHVSDIAVVEDVHQGPWEIFVKMDGTLICDIDGTIADLTHRRKYVASKPKNYPAFEKTMYLDSPIQYICDTVNRLFSAGWTVLMCSGRSEKNREITEGWLDNYGPRYHMLYMRSEFEVDENGEVKKTRKGTSKPDHRKDNIVKSELLDRIYADGFKPDIVFDDRDQVVEMWRSRGLPCVQVAEGDF